LCCSVRWKRERERERWLREWLSHVNELMLYIKVCVFGAFIWRQ
jgi:hypothetical protein